MNDLYDAMRKAVSDYMNLEDLNPRSKARLRQVHDKFAYDYDTVDRLTVIEEPTDETE